jgi:non-specific serine/threonine protein kinase
LTREYYDSFDLQGPDGRHHCLVLQPMLMSLLEMMGLNPRPFDPALLKITVVCFLLAFDFLHTEASVIYDGIRIVFDLYGDVMLTGTRP